MVEPKQ